jgi:hypothetical protein
MAKFKVTATRRCSELGQADFVVEWLQGILAPGAIFTVYETHHPIEVKVLSSTPHERGAILRCQVNLGWDGNYAPSVIDSDALTRTERFRYDI